MKTVDIMERLKIPEWKAKVVNVLTKEHASSHSDVDDILGIIETLLEGYGVEPLRGDHVDNYYMDINILYINLGDTYTPTVLYDTLLNRFFICSWGDYIESKPKRFPMNA
jgi:hypothetical protein